jgi:hypothetical protein
LFAGAHILSPMCMKPSLSPEIFFSIDRVRSDFSNLVPGVPLDDFVRSVFFTQESGPIQSPFFLESAFSFAGEDFALWTILLESF